MEVIAAQRVAWQPEGSAPKIAVLIGLIALTLGIHYGWLVEPFFGHVHWVHAIHGRLLLYPDRRCCGMVRASHRCSCRSRYLAPGSSLHRVGGGRNPRPSR